MAAPERKRAGDIVQGISPSLDEIAGTDVVVMGVSISERPMRGETQTYVEITLEDGTKYHAWSPSLAEKLAQIPDEELNAGVICMFEQVKTRAGFKVWSVS